MSQSGVDPDDNVRSTVVIGERDVLVELAAGAGALPIQRLLERPLNEPLGESAQFVTVDPKDLELELLGHSLSVQQELKAAFSSRATKLLTSKAGVVVVWMFNSSDDLPRLEAWVGRFAKDAQRHAQPDLQDGAQWTLIIVAKTDFMSADVELLKRVVGSQVDKNAEQSRLFQRCYLMTPELRASEANDVFRSAAVWPVAVGYLLMHLRMKSPRPNFTGCPFFAWSALVLRSISDQPKFDEIVLDACNKVLTLAPEEKTPRAFTRKPINKDGAPGHADDREIDGDKGRFLSSQSESQVEFAESSAGAGLTAVTKRVIDWPVLWRTPIKSRFKQFRDERQTTRSHPFGDDRLSAKIVRESWEDIGKDWSFVKKYAGGGACLPPHTSIERQLADQGDRWDAMIKHAAAVESAVAATAEVAKEFDDARNGFAGLGWRLAAVVSVSLFVGILVSTAIAGLTNSSVKGAAIAGFAASSGALVVAIAMRWMEHRAGSKAAKRLSTEIGNRECEIRNGVLHRLEIGSGADMTSGIVAWRVMLTSIQALASRLLAIGNNSVDSGLQTMGSHQMSVDAVYRDARARFEKLSSIAIGGVNLEDAERANRTDLENEILKLQKKFQKDWESFAKQTDPSRGGGFPARSTWEFLSGQARTIRSKIDQWFIERLLAQATSAKTTGESVIPTQFFEANELLPLLSVRTDRYSDGGSVDLPAGSVSHRLWKQQSFKDSFVDSSKWKETDQLDGANGILAISMQECKIDLVSAADGSVTFKELRTKK